LAIIHRSGYRASSPIAVGPGSRGVQPDQENMTAVSNFEIVLLLMAVIVVLECWRDAFNCLVPRR
jgi:hypothetical protein